MVTADPDVLVVELTSRRRLALGLALAAGLVATSLITLASASVIPVAGVVLVLAVAAWAPAAGWRASFALCLLGALVLEVCLQWLSPHVGWSLWTDDLIAWTLAGALHAAILTLRPPRIQRAGLVTAGMTALPAVIVLTYFWLAWRRPGPPWVSWGMQNDAATNTYLARQLIEDGGLLQSQANAAPLATALHGAWAAGGIDGFRVSGIVRHVVLSGEQLTIAIWILVGVTTSILAVGRRTDHPGRRVVVALAAGLLPWTWFVSGWSITLGFMNFAPAVLILLLGWLCWTEQERHPVAALTGTILATWAAGVAWGPIAAFPAFWSLGVLWFNRRALRTAGRTLLLPAGTFIAACLYAVLVTLDQVAANENALAFDGAHPPLNARWTIGVIVAILIATAVLHRRTPALVRRGVWCSLPPGLLGIGYLLNARKDMPTLWGYYPVKFSWIVLCVCVLLAFAALQPGVGRIAHRAWRGTGVLVVLALLYIAMFNLIRPAAWVPVSLGTVASPVALHDSIGQDWAAERMYRIMRKHPKSMVARFSPGGAANDSFINFWLLRSAQTSFDDPMFGISYTLDSTNAQSLCMGIQAWRGGVWVWTRDPKLRHELARYCDPAYPYRVKVLGD